MLTKPEHELVDFDQKPTNYELGYGKTPNKGNKISQRATSFNFHGNDNAAPLTLFFRGCLREKPKYFIMISLHSWKIIDYLGFQKN